MDKLNLVEKLREKTGITYEDAKRVLEINNWDILEAILDLEKQGKVKKPSVSIFYTNEYNESYEEEGTEFNFEEVKKDSNYKYPRFGVAVGKKVGNAVIRNRLKRQTRMIITTNKKIFIKIQYKIIYKNEVKICQK